jgi:uncharacterized protein (UPF0303 family)
MPPNSDIFPTAAEVARSTAKLVFSRFDEIDALAVGQSLTDMAMDGGFGVVINIRSANRTLYHAALPGAAALNDLWAQRKSNTALLFGKSSLEVGCNHRETGGDLARHGLDSAKYADHGGAVPVMVEGLGMVAVVTVSGLPQLDDHAMVLAALQAHLDQHD